MRAPLRSARDLATSRAVARPPRRLAGRPAAPEPAAHRAFGAVADGLPAAAARASTGSARTCTGCVQARRPRARGPDPGRAPVLPALLVRVVPAPRLASGRPGGAHPDGGEHHVRDAHRAGHGVVVALRVRDRRVEGHDHVGAGVVQRDRAPAGRRCGGRASRARAASGPVSRTAAPRRRSGTGPGPPAGRPAPRAVPTPRAAGAPPSPPVSGRISIPRAAGRRRTVVQPLGPQPFGHRQHRYAGREAQAPA